MVNERKKAYMREYNAKPEVKTKKAAYMRARRAELAKQKAISIVHTFLDFGYEDLAFEYAKEHCPELLSVVKSKNKRK